MLNDKAEVVKDYRYGTYGQDELPEMQAYGGKQSVELWRQEVEKIDNPFRYCGEYQDEETGNYYLRARYYDPSVQRFINEDSYGISYGAAWKQNLYSYVGNNPINYQDPSGHLSEIINKITKSLYHSYKAGKTYIRARRTSNGKESVELARIAYANRGSVWFDSKTKQAAITLNGQTRWFSTKDWYTENGHIWINPETFNKMFGIKGTGKTSVGVWNSASNFIKGVGTNLMYTINWAIGNDPNTIVYSQDSRQLKDMQKSKGAEKLRREFFQHGEANVTGVSFGTWEAFKKENPFLHCDSTAAEVGGFAGATAINNGNGTVTFTIANVTGLKSAAYHVLPNSPYSTGPMHNVKQVFRWTEPILHSH